MEDPSTRQIAAGTSFTFKAIVIAIILAVAFIAVSLM